MAILSMDFLPPHSDFLFLTHNLKTKHEKRMSEKGLVRKIHNHKIVELNLFSLK
jgi:hypothetical protein